MRFVWSAIIFFSTHLQTFAADYLLFEENGKVGLKDTKGVVVIPAAFDALGWSDGSFSVIGQVTGYKLDQKWGLINMKEQRITNAEFENLIPSGGDRIIVKQKVDLISSKFGCIDLKGKITVPPQYDGIQIFGLQAIVFQKTGINYRYGLIDLNNTVLVPLEYKSIRPIGSLRYGVENFQNKTALYSETGKQLTNYQIDSISSFIKNKAIVYEGYKQGIINREGIIEVTPEYREIKINEDGSIQGQKMTEWKKLDSQNNTLLSATGDFLLPDGKIFSYQMLNKIGVINENFEPLIPTSYTYLGKFKNGKAVAGLGNKFGVIRMDNSTVLPIQFDSVCLGDRLVRVKEKLLGKPSWSLYDTFGIKKTEKTYEIIHPYNGRFYKVKNYGLTGIVDKYGKETIHCLYDSLITYNEDQLVVKFHGQYGIIDFNENWLLPPQRFPVTLVDEDHYLLRQPNLTELKNFKNDLIYFTDNRIEITNNYLREYLVDGTEKEINLEGVTLSRTTPPLTEDTQIISSESEGFRGIKRNGRYGFIDEKGRLRIANRYEGIGQFHHGLAAVKILGKWGFVDKNDKIAVNPSFEEVSEFFNGLAIAKKQKYGFIDREGRIILETRYDSIYKIGTGNFIITLNNLKGLSNQEGRVLIEPRFEYVQDLGNGFVIVARDGKYGLLTLNGLSTIPMIYDYLVYLKQTDNYLAKSIPKWERLN